MTTARAAPILWFGPPDVAVGQGSPAGQQVMDLFDDPAAWQVTASQSVGFVLSEYFILTATDQQLGQVFGFLAQRHLKMMMVAGMIPVQANGFGNGVEGYAAGSELG